MCFRVFVDCAPSFHVGCPRNCSVLRPDLAASELYDTNQLERRPQKTCRKTQIYPFHVGCPRNCSVLRPDLAASELYDTNQLERSGIVWWTGHYGGYDSVWPLSAWGISRNISISPEFVHTYASAEETLIDMLAQKKDTKNLSIKRGHNIHIALSYFCCWTPEELEKARDIIAKWIKSLQVEGRGEGHGKDDKDIMVNFDRLSCYQERENSVTVIIEADSISQRRLLKMNREMKQKLIEEGIPVVLDRTEQIPFHATLLNIYEENDNTSSHLATPSLNLYEAKSSDDEVAAGVNSMSNNTGAQLKTPAADAKGRTTPDLISPYLPFIAKAVKDVDTYFENRWTMRNPVKIPIVEATQRCGEGNTKGSSPSRADSKWAAECLKP
eukprot:CAMPEP_0184503612 /NCGR_PEP_ID=MMETSP0113_2-20130426/51997_1 /TAXON_ID=91329 /ORGANISM="Norrisiella sphaerica, Strain BC52" /LENGTH=382 /DNA_ID=CAMNT_0026893145 /DNA_START=797 /DNA_END=1945 /DNA_ORIENTATION=+